MTLKNSAVVDFEQRTFSVCDLVSLRFVGPCLWKNEDVDDETSRGSIFRAFEEGEDGHYRNVAAITVVDATDDPAEPDVSSLEPADVPALDRLLHEQTRAQLEARGSEVITWMSSQLNSVGDFKGLVTIYVYADQGETQKAITVRIKAKGRKVVVLGQFDIARQESMAVPIIDVMRTMIVLP